MSPPRRRRTSRLRKAALQLGLTLLGLAVFELGLRALGVEAAPQDDPFVGFDKVVRLYEPDPERPGSLVTSPARRNHFNVQGFAVPKPEGLRRVVCLGGSTTYGRPYTDAVSFPGWLRELLPLVDPESRWEVINAGGVSYASYRVAVVLDEIAAYEPDLVVIYTGHNEFLEERTYGELRDASGLLLRLGVAVRHTACFQLARRIVGTAPREVERFELGAEVETILDGSVGLDAYERDEALAAQVAEHFEDGLRRMVRTARGAGAEVLLVVPASQLDDCRPFKSEGPSFAEADLPVERLTPTELRDRALALDPRSADLLYGAGHAVLERHGDVATARDLLVRARDEDVVPLRATSTLQDIVRRVAAERDVLLLDAVAVTDALARRLTGVDIPGEEVFLDHVHMTPEGYGEVALGLVDTLLASGWLTAREDWRADLPALIERVEARLTTEDHVRALARLAAVLDWAGKSDEAARHTRTALELSGGGDAMSLWMQGNRRLEQGDRVGAVDSYTRALEIDPGYTEAHLNLAMALLQGDTPEAMTRALHHAEQAEALGGASARTAFARGLALERLGRVAEARSAYEVAAGSADGHADAGNRLGLLALSTGDSDGALRAFEDAAAADPRAARPLYNLGQVLANLGRAEEAEQAWRRALQRDPEHPGANARLGLSLADRAQWAEARPLLELAVRARPGDTTLARALDAARAAGG